jgi:hypothetical protein
MPGLVPGIHAFLLGAKAWMAGTSPAMTALNAGGGFTPQGDGPTTKHAR